MFKLTPKESTPLEQAIDELIGDMRNCTDDPEKYAQLAKSVETLQKAKSYEKDRRVSPDVLVTVGANFIGIIAVLHFEKINVVTSKAFGMISKVAR